MAYFVIVFGVITILSFISVFHFHDTQLDDAFITYRYARSVAAGQGFHYNPDEVTIGTTTPLYTISLALAAKLGLEIPTASLIFNAISLALLTGVVFVIISQVASRSIGLLAALTFLLLPGDYISLGMETLTHTMFTVFALYACEKKRYLLAIVISAVVTLVRYDGILVTGVIGLAILLEQRRIAWKEMLVYAAFLIPWMMYATIVSGSPLPNAFYAKTGSSIEETFLSELPETFAIQFAYRPYSLVPVFIVALFLFLLVIGCIYTIKERKFWQITAWAFLYLLGYNVLGLKYFHHWYYYPLAPATFLLLVFGLNTIARIVHHKTANLHQNRQWLLTQSSWLLGIPFIIIFGLGFMVFWRVASTTAVFGGRYYVYQEAALWLCENSSPDETITVPEIGIVGWYCPRTIIDPYGLVSPQLWSYIKAGTVAQGVGELRPDYVLIPNCSLDSSCETFDGSEFFPDTYHLIKTFTREKFPYTFAIYAKAAQ